MDITLRNIEISDNIFLFQLENSPAGKTARQNPYLLPLNEINDEIEKYLSQKNKRNFIQIILFGNQNAGAVELHNINQKRYFAEIGIIIAEEFQHKGIGSAGMNVFFENIYKTLKINKINAKINCENVISMQFFQKNNFIVEEKNENFYTLARFLCS
ncbi:MAG: GNAT family N-acetyltransferase [Bacteroidales bacterium]|jgi:ribosomal-protein-alanine N-acetyltransferase|nr:GNAT family N-acetyltransferase [Bacteroidales bacterium]